MKLVLHHISEAYGDYLEPDSTIQIYGTLSDALAHQVAAESQGTEDAVIIREPFTGFSRLPAA
jgi:hypothetical protein